MVNICMLYWDMGCNVRKQNSIIAWEELKKMTKFLQNKKIEVNSYMFEFGNNFIFNDSIKIETKLEYYEKSKKNNLIINHSLNESCNYISIMDCDLIFLPNQYETIGNHIRELEESKDRIFYTYNLLDIYEKERSQIIDVNSNKLNYDKLDELKENYVWRHSWGSGVLGGFFFVPTNEIKNMGGFDEKFLTWGAEDDDAHVRLKEYAIWCPKQNQGPYHLWHPKNETDNKFYIRVYSDEYFKINKVKKPN